MSTALNANDYSKAVNTIQSEGQVKPKTKFAGRNTTKNSETSQVADVSTTTPSASQASSLLTTPSALSFSVTDSNFRGNSRISKTSPNVTKSQTQKVNTLDTTTKTDIFGRPIKPANMSLYSLDKQYTEDEGQLALSGAITAASYLPVAKLGKGAVNIGGAVIKGSEGKIKNITDAIANLLKGNKTTMTTQSGKAIKFKKTNPRAVFNTK